MSVSQSTHVCVSVSEAPVEAPKPQKYESFSVDTFKSDEQKKDEVRLLAGLLYTLQNALKLILPLACEL